MTDLVSSVVDRGVALVTLNRPERLNAVDREMGPQFDAVMAGLAADTAVRVVVLTGAGRAFCAGADMERLRDLRVSEGRSLNVPTPGEPDPLFDAIDAPPELRARYLLPMALPQPVIAAVNGACAGVGFLLACACDLRFASQSAVFAAAFSRIGLTAEGGLAWRLPQLIGEGASADLLFSGRKVAAPEALSLGLVKAVAPPEALMAETMAYARDLADKVSPRSLRVIKRQLRAARAQTPLEALALAHREVVASLASADFAEGLAAFLEHRPPHFPGGD
ncbi:MAG: enoyl-CoA hydratase/isomerase family protein [Caulobacteraceae bacterium]|nr:enoyl-CoA hydratase/isomerase family protein [Caulobacteraceae bacterium]